MNPLYIIPVLLVLVAIIAIAVWSHSGATTTTTTTTTPPPTYVDGTWKMVYAARSNQPSVVKRRDGYIYCHGSPASGGAVGYCYGSEITPAMITAANAAIAAGEPDPFTEVQMCSPGGYCAYTL